MNERSKIRKRKKRKIILESILSITILLSVFLGSVAGYYGSKVRSFLDTISEENTQSEEEIIKNTEQIKNLGPFSVLILGVDEEDGGASRSDTIILATLNPETESMKLVSIPRDTFVTLPDGRIEKINAAYASGGSHLAKEMVSEYLDLPIDFYAAMNFDGLVELVDAVDGITVNPDFEFSWDGHLFKNEGAQKINGEEALAYSRMRKKDPKGDFGRQDRQKEVIVSILNKLNSSKSVTNFDEILNAISPYLKTDVHSNQMVGVALNYSSVLKDIDQISLRGENRRMYFPKYGKNLSIWEANELNLMEVQGELKDHLNIQQSKSRESINANGIEN